MKRTLLIVLLSFGTVAGYASGIHRLRHGYGCGGWAAGAEHGCWKHAGPPPCQQPRPEPPAAPAPKPPAPESPPTGSP